MSTPRKQKDHARACGSTIRPRRRRDHYISIFKDGKINAIDAYGDAGPGPKGTVDDNRVRARRPAVSRPERRTDFQVHRGDFARRRLQVRRRKWTNLGEAFGRRQQESVRLAEGQVRPVVADRSVDPVVEMVQEGPDPKKNTHVHEAMFTMQKLDIPQLEGRATTAESTDRHNNFSIHHQERGRRDNGKT